MQIGVRDARQQFSAIVDRAIAVETVIITRNGREVARLEPPHTGQERRGGWMTTPLQMADDFDDLPEDLLDALNGDNSGEPST